MSRDDHRQSVIKVDGEDYILKPTWSFISLPINFNRAERRKRIREALSHEERLLVQEEQRDRIMRLVKGQEGPRETIEGIVSKPYRNPTRAQKRYRNLLGRRKGS